MGHRLAKLVLAASMTFGAWKGAQALPPPPLTEVFNNESTLSDTVPQYKLSSIVLPESAEDLWRIRLGSWEMAQGGHHTFLEFGPYCQKTKPCADDLYQIHGIAIDPAKNTQVYFDFKKPGTYSEYVNNDYTLKAFGVDYDYNEKVFHKNPDAYVDVFYGSKDEVLRLYLDAMKLADTLNDQGSHYEILDQNSNSIQRTLLDGLGLKVPSVFVPHVLSAKDGRIWTPGIELSLLPSGWDRQRLHDTNDHDRLSGDALEQTAKKVSRGMKSVLADIKSPAPPQGPV